MKLTIIVNFYDSVKLAIVRALAAGCARHGDCAEIMDVTKCRDLADTVPVVAPDAVCCWGWGRPAQRQNKLGRNVLVMERAYVADRFKWVSLGWNGLNGRATFPAPQDGGARWRQYFAQLMHPWKTNPDGYALLLGQVPNDYAVRAINFEDWAGSMVNELSQLGHKVRFRPHPQARTVRTTAPLADGTLEEALACAAFAVTWNSNSGVEAVLTGTPTVTMDRGAMAWEVTSHDLAAPIARPNREAWAQKMAYAQWLPEEIERGDAWEYLRHLV